MQHTYLRYECADAFGLICSSAASKIPHSNASLAFVSDSSSCPIVLSSTGSHCTGFHLRTTNPTVKIAHPEDIQGGVGTGRALNSTQIVTLTVSRPVGHETVCRVATGWVDGAVRVFSISREELNTESERMVHTFLAETDFDPILREPLVFDGHSGSPIRSLAFDPKNKSRLASGSSDGSVILWDVENECGLFRLLGHRGAITDVHFVHIEGSLDLLITSSLDGLVKVWDLASQCCVETIASNRGKVWASDCMIDYGVGDAEDSEDSWRARLVTGDDDGRAKVWSISGVSHQTNPQKYDEKSQTKSTETSKEAGDQEVPSYCSFMGALRLPSNVHSSSGHIAGIRFHPNGKYVGVFHVNSKSIYVYAMRDKEETVRRKQRRVSRQRQKEKGTDGDQKAHSISNVKKRGILDDEDADDNGKAEPGVEMTEANDEFEFLGVANASHKIRSFVFVPWKERGSVLRIVCSLATNAIEVVALTKPKSRTQNHSPPESTKVSLINNYGHSTGIRAIEMSSDDSLACSISKGCFKIWNVARRKCVQSVSHVSDGLSFYGLCAAFLPGNSHVVIGTREGNLLLLDIAAGEVVSVEKAHDAAIWSLDVRPASEQNLRVSVVTGSADKTVKFWHIEENDEAPLISHTRTLEMSDDVVAVRYSNTKDPSKRMVFVSSLDSTVKIFFDDTLKFFLSLYGHKLPVLAVDASDDDAILATAGADKLVKVWGLDFGDTHGTLHGHEDSITDLRFVRRTHNFFTSSKDGTLRYWDGGRLEQVLVLNGHFAEVSSLAISRTGACVLSAGMDRQVRVWERTKDIVFLDEERGLELERKFDRVEMHDDFSTGEILRRKAANDEGDNEEEVQSEAAIKRSVLSVAAGDRILAALELADMELKSRAAFQKGHSAGTMTPNPLLLGMDPPSYILWVLKTVKHAELEQSLLVLPLEHVARMLYYLVVALRRGQGTETCSRAAVFLVKTHQNQMQANHWKVAKALQELRRLLRLRLEEGRSIAGFNLSGLREVAKNHSAPSLEKTPSDFTNTRMPKGSIWGKLGIGDRKP